MDGKTAQLQQWLQGIRQDALTNSLGQPTCPSGCHDIATVAGAACPTCRAVV